MCSSDLTGKAPTEEMRSVFQLVLHWMRRAYKTIKDIAFGYKVETAFINLEQAFKEGKLTQEQYERDLADIKEGKADKYGQELPALTREVRQVFDRIFASEEEIRKTKMVRGYVTAFQTREEFVQNGGDPQDWEEYKMLVAEADFQAFDDLMRKSIANVRWLSRAKAREIRERAEEAKKIREGIEKAVDGELRGKPVYRARYWLKTEIGRAHV